MKQPAISVPDGCSEVLLHACCAPCSSAIVEWLLNNGVCPTIFYYNPNIWPREEYEIRKNESKRHAEGLGIRWIDGDYDHDNWLKGVCGLESEPERGRRCELCFTLRLMATARKAQELGIRYFTTTLASSRWKSLDQINRAGLAAEQVANEDYLPFILHPSCVPSVASEQSSSAPFTLHQFIKPISCALYPIREKVFSDGTVALNYHQWDICRCGREKGKALHLPVYQFLKGPLIRRFGEAWYQELCDVAEVLNSPNHP